MFHKHCLYSKLFPVNFLKSQHIFFEQYTQWLIKPVVCDSVSLKVFFLQCLEYIFGSYTGMMIVIVNNQLKISLYLTCRSLLDCPKNVILVVYAANYTLQLGLKTNAFNYNFEYTQIDGNKFKNHIIYQMVHMNEIIPKC